MHSRLSAAHLLEATTHPVERIATQTGFGSPTAFRERSKRVVGTSPHAYRAGLPLHRSPVTEPSRLGAAPVTPPDDRLSER